MPTGDLVPGSDGSLTMVVGPWAKEKLHYVRRYCHIFNTGMKDKWETRTYVDLFCGPGKCVIEGTEEETEGSPLIALQCEVPFTHYFFNDISSLAIDSLRKRARSFSFATIDYFNLDCNDLIDHLLLELPSSSLDFCFIDPTNWQIKFDSIRKLTRERRMDLAITFHTGAIRRIADDPPVELNDFFDGPSWRGEYETKLLTRGQASGKGRLLLDIYERRLRSLGYMEVQDYLPVRNTKSALLYHLVFASKHPRGKDFWDKISQKTSSGQIRLF